MSPEDQAQGAGRTLFAIFAITGEYRDGHNAAFVAFCSPDRVRGWVEEDRAKDELIRAMVDRVEMTDGFSRHTYWAVLTHEIKQPLTDGQAALLRTILNKEGT